jgi:hypothetical protein
MQRLRGLKDTWVNSCGQQLRKNLKFGKKIMGPEQIIRVD